MGGEIGRKTKRRRMEVTLLAPTLVTNRFGLI